MASPFPKPLPAAFKPYYSSSSLSGISSNWAFLGILVVLPFVVLHRRAQVLLHLLWNHFYKDSRFEDFTQLLCTPIEDDLQPIPPYPLDA